MNNVPSFSHEMLREIYEQPAALLRTLAMYLDGNHLRSDVADRLADWANPSVRCLLPPPAPAATAAWPPKFCLKTSAGLPSMLSTPASTVAAVAMKQGRPPSSLLVLSQSGETSDTLAALREANRRGQHSLAITNAKASTMARKADVSMPLGAGVEKAIPPPRALLASWRAVSFGPL